MRDSYGKGIRRFAMFLSACLIRPSIPMTANAKEQVMKTRIVTQILISVLAISALTACGNSSNENAPAATKDTEIDADSLYESGRNALYGLNGQEISYETAYDNFEQALEKGKAEANFYLGILYSVYGYPKRDYEKAKSFFEAAPDNTCAKVSLGDLYCYGQGVEKDEIKAQGFFDAAIAEGYTEGYYGNGNIAWSKNDYEAALEYYNKALECEEQLYVAEAMVKIAIMYENGIGVEQDYAKAMEWLEKAADLGRSSAMLEIGLMYEKGEGVERDYAKATEWYEKIAGLGDSDAMFQVGFTYEYGGAVEQDYAKAMEWLEKAADLGSSAAMREIGFMYEAGIGVELDYAKAMEWLEKAADLGDSSAMFAIGIVYGYGIGAEQDYAKAMEWYEKAADLGSFSAMVNIGNMYEAGNGAEQDPAKAREWYDKADAARQKAIIQ